MVSARSFSMALVLVLLGGIAADATDLPPVVTIAKDKWDCEQLPQGLRLKSLTFEPKYNVAQLVFEFTTNCNYTAKDFSPNASDPLFSFYFVDDENVTVAKHRYHRLEGEIRPFKGQAFRVVVELPDRETRSRTQRVEIRR